MPAAANEQGEREDCDHQKEGEGFDHKAAGNMNLHSL